MPPPLFDSKKAVEQAAMVFVAAVTVQPAEQALPEDLVLLSLALFIAYRDGLADGSIVPDEEKALHYLALALFLKPPKSMLDFSLTWFGWFTSVRLATVRGNRLLSVHPVSSFLDTHLTHPHPNHNYSMTGGPYGFFNTLQLSYGPELFACLIKLLKKAFRQETNEDLDKIKKWPRFMHKFASLYYRFDSKRAKQLLQHRDFRRIVFNAGVWLFVNLIVYICFPALCWPAAMLNLAAFAYDIWHDYRYTNQELNDNKKLLGLQDLVQQNELTEPLNNDFDNLLNKLNISGYKSSIEIVINKKINDLTEKRFRVTCVAIGIFFGMMFFYAPFFIATLPAIIPSIGAYTVLAMGVCWGGLGGRLRAEIDKQNITKSVIRIGYQALPYLTLAAVFSYLLVNSLVSVPALITFACVVPAIRTFWQKKSNEWAQNELYKKQQDAIESIKGTGVELELKETLKPVLAPLADMNNGYINLENFCIPNLREQEGKATDNIGEEKNRFNNARMAGRVAANITDDKEWLKVVADMSRENNKRRPNSTVAINQILNYCNIPPRTPASTAHNSTSSPQTRPPAIDTNPELRTLHPITRTFSDLVTFGGAFVRPSLVANSPSLVATVAKNSPSSR